MRKQNGFTTTFWSNAAKSLPRRYKAQLQSAESLDMMFDEIVWLWKAAVSLLGFAPRRSAH